MPMGSREQQRIQSWAQETLAAPAYWMILDTETTGFSNDDELLEIVAVNLDGDVLINTLIRPQRRIPPLIQQKTGITDALCADKPAFADICQFLDPQLNNRQILGYNVSFDIRQLRNAFRRVYVAAWSPQGSACLMQAYSAYSGQGRVKHELACRQMRISQKQAHRALGDCLTNLALLRAMAQGRVPLSL